MHWIITLWRVWLCVASVSGGTHMERKKCCTTDSEWRYIHEEQCDCNCNIFYGSRAPIYSSWRYSEICEIDGKTTIIGCMIWID